MLNCEQILQQYIQKKADQLVPQDDSGTLILYRADETIHGLPLQRKVGLVLSLFALGGLLAAIWPFLGLDLRYFSYQVATSWTNLVRIKTRTLIASAEIQRGLQEPVDPLMSPTGQPIVPVNMDFGLVIPKIGINASVIPGVNPAKPVGYMEALEKGVAHASTSFYPNENGTVYLFSHSTNYEWFVKDLNAVFYLLKNVKPGDLVVVMYLGNRYTYKIRETKVVAAGAVSYLKPQAGVRGLILQTCWPPGSSYKRLLIFADFVEEKIDPNYHSQPATSGSTAFGKLMSL